MKIQILNTVSADNILYEIIMAKSFQFAAFHSKIIMWNKMNGIFFIQICGNSFVFDPFDFMSN